MVRGEQTQLAKTPFPPKKRAKVRGIKLLKLHQDIFFRPKNIASRLGLILVMNGVIFMRALFLVALTKWVSLFFVHPLISVGVNKDQDRVLRPAKLVAFEGSQTQGVLVKVG